MASIESKIKRPVLTSIRLTFCAWNSRENAWRRKWKLCPALTRVVQEDDLAILFNWILQKRAIRVSRQLQEGGQWEQLESLPPLCKNIAGGWTQNAISILFAKYRLVSEVLGIWFFRRASYNFVHNFLLISVKDWYSCQLLVFSSDDIVCWSKFSNFDMRVGCQKLSAMLNLRLSTKKFSFCPKKIFVSCYFQYVYLPFETNFFVLKIPFMAKSLLWNSLSEKYIKLRLLLKWSWKW